MFRLPQLALKSAKITKPIQTLGVCLKRTLIVEAVRIPMLGVAYGKNNSIPQDG